MPAWHELSGRRLGIGESLRCDSAPSWRLDAPAHPGSSSCRRAVTAANQHGGNHGRGQSRTHSGICHAVDPRRRQARPDHGRAGDTDLPDRILCVRRRRSRRLAVRPAGLRQYLHPHRQSDLRGAGGTGGRAGRRHRRPRARLRPCRAGDHAARADDAGRRTGRLQEALWRLDQPVHPFVQEFRLERQMGRPRRYCLVRARALRQDQGDLRRIDRQSRRHHHRHRSGGQRSRARPACR